jgi:hypothetical protein
MDLKAALPIPGLMVSILAIKYAQKRDESLSFSSSETQATGWSDYPAHSLSSAVFPKPAGAETRVSLRERLAFNRPISRGLCTIAALDLGILSLVFNNDDSISIILVSIDHNCKTPLVEIAANRHGQERGTSTSQLLRYIFSSSFSPEGEV